MPLPDMTTCGLPLFGYVQLWYWEARHSTGTRRKLPEAVGGCVYFWQERTGETCVGDAQMTAPGSQYSGKNAIRRNKSMFFYSSPFWRTFGDGLRPYGTSHVRGTQPENIFGRWVQGLWSRGPSAPAHPRVSSPQSPPSSGIFTRGGWGGV